MIFKLSPVPQPQEDGGKKINHIEWSPRNYEFVVINTNFAILILSGKN